MIATMLALMLAPLSASADPKDKKEAKADFKVEQLVGEWEMIGCHYEGKKIENAKRREQFAELSLEKMIITEAGKANFVISQNGKENVEIFKDTIYRFEEAKNPGTGIAFLDGNENNNGVYFRFKLEKDTLSIAVSLDPEKNRKEAPKGFETEKDDMNYVYLFKLLPKKK